MLEDFIVPSNPVGVTAVSEQVFKQPEESRGVGALLSERLQAYANKLGSALLIMKPTPVVLERFPTVVDSCQHFPGSFLFDHLDDCSSTVARQIRAEHLHETVVPGWQISPFHDQRGSRFRESDVWKSGDKPFVEHSSIPRGLGPPNVLPLTRAVLHTAGARLENDTPSMTANGTASGAAAKLGRSLLPRFVFWHLP
jgi:hypothetical protein